MGLISSGVFPCYENQFEIKTDSGYKGIADCETFECSFDNGIEEWTPFESEGWVRRLMTAKGLSITVSGKRNVGDAGNDYIASLTFANGQDAQTDFKWTFPDGTILEIKEAVISVNSNSGGDSTAVAPLEFEVQSNGKPTITLP